MPVHVLLIEGMSILNSNWYADQLIRTSPYLSPPACIVTRVSFDYGENTQAVQLAMGLRHYNAIIVCDLSHDQNMFAIALGSCIQSYVRSGGRVAFPTTEGLNLIPVLKELFDVPWTRSNYGREQWVASPQSAALLSEQFPLQDGQKAADLQFYLKGCSYRNVPQSDRCFEAQQYQSEYGGRDSNSEYDASVADQDPLTLVAVRSYYGGHVAYFGDVNCELPTAKLVGAFATAPQKCSPSSLENSEIMRRATEAKEEGNIQFRNAEYERALSFYISAQKHLDPITESCKEEYSKVLGNIAECWLRLNQWSEAIATSTKALQLHPSNAKAFYRRTRAYLMAARDDINVLKKHEDGHASAISQLHNLAMKLSDLTMPEADTNQELGNSTFVKRATGILGKSATELKELGNEKFKAGMYEFAVSFYEAALLVGPSNESDHVNILCNLSLCYLRKEEWKQAAKAANDALAVNPNAEKALMRRAQAYIRLKKFKDAHADVHRLQSIPRVPWKEMKAISDELKHAMNPAKAERENGSHEQSSEAQSANGVPVNLDRPVKPWYNGLDQNKRYEWLVDCYRMRLDDEHCWGGELRCGSLYDPDRTADSMTADFLVFCKLVVAKGALPDTWDWRQFLNHAIDPLHFPFEKSDAEEKYGSEVFFEGLGFLGSGRSLRFTAKEVYVSDVTNRDEKCEEYNAMCDLVHCRCFHDTEEVINFRRAKPLFVDVGGMDVWREFLQSMRRHVYRSYSRKKQGV